MKKITVLLLTAGLVLSLAACGSAQQVQSTEAPEVTAAPAATEVPEETVGMANPMTEYESLEEVNEITGMALTGPAVMGKANEQYFVIDCGDYQLGEYDFELNGYAITLRGACTTEDISGIYTGDGTLFADVNGEGEKTTDTVRAARWFTLDGQYVLTAGTDCPEESFSALTDELKALTAVSNGEDDTAADYQGYQAVIDAVAEGLESNWADKTPEDVGVNNIFAYGEKSNLGYTFYDVNGDGVDELLLGESVENGDGTRNFQIYELYTTGEDGTAEHVFSGWERNRYYLTESGYIANIGSSGADDTVKAVYDLQNGVLVETAEQYDSQTMLDIDYTLFLS